MDIKTRRLNIDAETRVFYLEIRNKYSNLKLTNSKLFSLALTIGYQNGMREKLIKKEGFIRYKTIDSDLFSIMFLLAINEFGVDSDVWIQDPMIIFDAAEEYANAGIKILGELVKDYSFDLEDYLLSNIFEVYDESKIQSNFEKICLE